MTAQSTKNNMAVDTPLKKRLSQLMTDEEKEQPFSFATRAGISSSTFHGIWTKGSTSIHRSTAKKIADATGVDVDWLHKGIGEPYSVAEQQVSTEKEREQIKETADAANIDMAIMIEALTIVDSYLAEHNKRMDSDKKAELVVSIYDLLCKSPEAGSTITAMLKLAV
ncbi:helix-turn-helix transcriptional regulator [Psychrobacter sp. PSP]|uniref:helix-turn-helix domain-containing protein n=2 Tax=unclassified Psychrobacter TaxID=196806 RepID=UPI002094DF78|nr:helix-turn-helix transcriptional regulator [Psychrobacter sp. PSP]